jgi:5'(3')-deoxyribonucleotidase
MKTPTLSKIISNYKDYLTEDELVKLKELRKIPYSFSTQVNQLKGVLFSEETDFMLDSGLDAKERARGKNPMSQEYTDRVNRKRISFGVSKLNESGYAKDTSSLQFCEEVVRHSKNYKEYLQLKKTNSKQIVYVDMDNVLVNFQSGIDKISSEDKEKYGPNGLDNVPGIFSLMEAHEGAIEGFKWLSENFDTYILSTAPWDNPSAWQDKLLWVKKHLPKVAWKRLILSHHKNLLQGEYIIDDRNVRGVDKFQGKHIHFAKEGAGFDNWKAVVAYLKHLT